MRTFNPSHERPALYTLMPMQQLIFCLPSSAEAVRALHHLLTLLSPFASVGF